MTNSEKVDGISRTLKTARFYKYSRRRSKSVDNRKNYQSPPRMPNMEDTVKSIENDLYVSDSQPRYFHLHVPNF